MALRIGDRVRVKPHDGRLDESVGQLATVVEHISSGFVGIRYDKPVHGINVWGQPYQTTHSCIHVALLVAAEQEALW